MDNAEAYVKYCARYALENCRSDLEHFDKWVEKGLIARLTNVVENDFQVGYGACVFGRLSYLWRVAKCLLGHL